MSLWANHLCFGNGYGMKSPYFDAKFYWLAGQLYSWIGGFGAQLRSWQWFHPRPGERRRLNGREYLVFNSGRRWVRVEVSWSLVGFPRDLEPAHALLRTVKKELDAL